MNIGTAVVQRQGGGVFVVTSVVEPYVIAAGELATLAARSVPPRWDIDAQVLTLDTAATYRYAPAEGEDTTLGDVTMDRVPDA